MVLAKATKQQTKSSTWIGLACFACRFACFDMGRQTLNTQQPTSVTAFKFEHHVASMQGPGVNLLLTDTPPIDTNRSINHHEAGPVAGPAAVVAAAGAAARIGGRCIRGGTPPARRQHVNNDRAQSSRLRRPARAAGDCAPGRRDHILHARHCGLAAAWERALPPLLLDRCVQAGRAPRSRGARCGKEQATH